MPELPEVETTKRGLTPHIEGKTLQHFHLYRDTLRWPINLPQSLVNQALHRIERRAKYLLFQFDDGVIIAHLGMSGSMRIVHPDEPRKKHDHVELYFGQNTLLRYNDPRRFGALLWTEHPPETHSLLKHLGVEPLTEAFNATHLMQHGQRRKINLKQLIMDQQVVVGVGNIYATEALFMAGLHPARPANLLGLAEAERLCTHIKTLLTQAITQGGTTLRDFVNSDGKPGYFKQSLLAYGKEGEPCTQCHQPLRGMRINQRSTVYCAGCQT